MLSRLHHPRSAFSYATLSVLAVVSLVVFLALRCHGTPDVDMAVALRCHGTPDVDMAVTGRRPLVIVNGATQQLATTDYLTSAGGFSTNANPPAAGDVQSSTATITTTLITGALQGTTQTSTVVGTQNDFSISVSTTILRWSGASLATFTGFAGGTDGRLLLIVNASAGQTFKIDNVNVGSSVGNRVLNTANKDINIVGTGSAALLEYDGTATEWRMVSLFSTTIDYTTTFPSGLVANNLISGTTAAMTSGLVAQGTSSHFRTTQSTGTSLTCGTAPSATAATDSAGRITIGTSSSGNCSMTFAGTYTNTPSCVVRFDEAATNAAVTVTLSPTSLAISGASDGKTFNYICVGLI